MTDLQQIIFPSCSGVYKVVQFQEYIRDNLRIPLLRFSNKLIVEGTEDYHEKILERFAEEIGVKCMKIYGHDGLISHLPGDSAYKIVGAGTCRLFIDKKEAVFSGSSYGYELKIDKEHIRSLRPFFPDWIFIA
ncbi:MAG: hypothetical protein WC867_05950 [Candidatus Pacearchaeota archaeon]|jgi:hypothetical protein